MSVIELKNVSKSYGQGSAKVDALKDVDFEAQKGEVVLIEGPSGAGKSTFLTIAGALQNPVMVKFSLVEKMLLIIHLSKPMR